MITLEEVLSPENMREACRRVMANKGAAGVDGMTVRQLPAHFERHGASIRAHIREQVYTCRGQARRHSKTERGHANARHPDGAG